jgi:hypothetical protein
VGLGDTGVPGVVLDVDVVDLTVAHGQSVEVLVLGHRRQRDHVDRADQVSYAVVREERAGRQGRRVDVEAAHAGDEVGQIDERRHRLEGRRGRLRLGQSGNREGESRESGEGEGSALAHGNIS